MRNRLKIHLLDARSQMFAKNLWDAYRCIDAVFLLLAQQDDLNDDNLSIKWSKLLFIAITNAHTRKAFRELFLLHHSIPQLKNQYLHLWLSFLLINDLKILRFTQRKKNSYEFTLIIFAKLFKCHSRDLKCNSSKFQLFYETITSGS